MEVSGQKELKKKEKERKTRPWHQSVRVTETWEWLAWKAGRYPEKKGHRLCVCVEREGGPNRERKRLPAVGMHNWMALLISHRINMTDF